MDLKISIRFPSVSDEQHRQSCTRHIQKAEKALATSQASKWGIFALGHMIQAVFMEK